MLARRVWLTERESPSWLVFIETVHSIPTTNRCKWKSELKTVKRNSNVKVKFKKSKLQRQITTTLFFYAYLQLKELVEKSEIFTTWCSVIANFVCPIKFIFTLHKHVLKFVITTPLLNFKVFCYFSGDTVCLTLEVIPNHVWSGANLNIFIHDIVLFRKCEANNKFVLKYSVYFQITINCRIGRHVSR